MALKNLKQDCYCAFCKSRRKVYVKKHLSWINVLLGIVLAGAISILYFEDFNLKVLGLLGVSLMIMEAFMRYRWRTSLVCHKCGFDPILYCRSPQRASEQVRTFYEAAIQQPDFFLKKSPYQKIMKRDSRRRRPVMESFEPMKIGEFEALLAEEKPNELNEKRTDKELLPGQN